MAKIPALQKLTHIRILNKEPAMQCFFALLLLKLGQDFHQKAKE